MNDLKFAWRQLAKSPGFTLVAVLTLALGIGANTAIFSVVDGVLLKPLQFDRPGQLVQVWEAPSPGKRNSASPGAFLDWQEHSQSFESLSLLNETDLNLTGRNEPERLSGLTMSASGLQIFRARPLLGRVFAPDEDQPGKDKVIVLSHRLWQRRFGGATNIVGDTLLLNDQSYTVIGVLPPRFLPWDRVEFVIPGTIAPQDRNQRSAHWLSVIGRLKPDVTLEQARTEINAVMARLKPLYPAHKKDWGATVIPMQEQLTGDIKPTLLLLLGSVACVLLIACANVANLLLARASARQKEMSVRAALGASHWRIIRQLLLESLLLAFLGAVPGVLLASWGVAGLSHLTAINLPRAHEVGLDLRVLGFALGASVLAGLVFGLAPALQSSRTNLNDALKDGARSSNRGGNQIRGALIIAEVALALVLLTGAGLLLNSFYRVSRVASGINPHNALAMQFSLPEKRYPDAARRAVFFDEVLAKVRQLPGVEVAAVTTALPLAGWSSTTSLTVSGRKEQPQAGYMCEFNFCTTDYFLAAGIPLLKGRAFGPQDRPGTPRVVVITETLAREYFRNEEPLGQRIHLEAFTGKVDEGWEIVGVVGDVHQRGLAEAPRPCVYRPQVYQFGGAQGHLVVRTSGPPMALAEPVRQAARAVDSTQPLARVHSLEEIVAVSLAQRRLLLMVLGGFAGAALLLAAIGLYGVIAYAVSQRSREIGIRMALGANRHNVLGLVLRDGFRLAGIGVLVGLLGAVGLTRLLAQLLYEVRPTDPLTFASGSLALLLVALLASWLPARKAARVDPMVALRQD